MSEDHAGELHPIAHVLAAVLRDAPDGPPTIAPEGLEAVRVALDEYLAAGPALMAAVDCVLTAAHLLEVEQGAKRAAVDLVALLDRSEIIEGLVAINDARDVERAEAVERQAGEFQRFTAGSPGKHPPEGDEQSEEGAVTLDAFHFPKRL